jgi:hypothetical protein
MADESTYRVLSPFIDPSPLLSGGPAMTYQVRYCQNLTIIDQFHADGRLSEVIYVHRSEYRSWDA